jgi:gas vesicle protein
MNGSRNSSCEILFEERDVTGPLFWDIETLIKRLSSEMAKTLDDQLKELRILANAIKEKFGFDLNTHLNSLYQNGEGKEAIDLIKQMVDKFLLLDEYIDSLR